MPARGVRLLDMRPDLGRDLPSADFAAARRTMVLQAAVVDPGPVDAQAIAEAARALGPVLGGVVTDGLLTREVQVDGRRVVSLRGPGDLVFLDGVPRTLPGASCTVSAVRRSVLAVLDEHFCALQFSWPHVAARMLVEAGRDRRRDGLPGGSPVEDRLLEVLWLAAARWGRDEGNGLAVDLPLTSELLARVVGARSATVALGLRELRLQERIHRRNGGWHLPRGTVVARTDELATRFRGAPPLDGVLGEALGGTMAFLGADFGNVQIYDEQDDVLRITIQRGLNQDFLDHFSEVHAGDGTACGTALSEGAQVVVPDVHREPRFAAHSEIAEATGIRAIHSTPLLDSVGRLQGVLSTHFQEPHRPSSAHLDVVRAQARVLADGLSRLAPPG